MKEITKQKLQTAKEICDEEDRSTEYMIQYMKDYANVELDCVIRFLKDSQLSTL